VRDAGVLTGKMRVKCGKYCGDVSHFLPGYNGIVQTFAMGITREFTYLRYIRPMLHYEVLNYCILLTLVAKI